MADWAWTPVTKALPPEKLLVLITVQIGNKRGTTIGFMKGEKWKLAVILDNYGNCVFINRSDAKVVAWSMPPEPYRKE